MKRYYLTQDLSNLKCQNEELFEAVLLHDVYLHHLFPIIMVGGNFHYLSLYNFVKVENNIPA